MVSFFNKTSNSTAANVFRAFKWPKAGSVGHKIMLATVNNLSSFMDTLNERVHKWQSYL